jgi:predicted DsbA family dithiol-disulfide isomerase
LEEHFGDRVLVERRSFPLRPTPDPTVRFKGTYREQGWARAAAAGAGEGLVYRTWERDDYPTWSLPALEAAKCAAAQGVQIFERMHFALFEAFFAQGRNIALREEVVAVAQEVGVDRGRFLQDFGSGRFREDILREYQEAHERYGVTASPTVIFDDRVKLVGAVPRAEYEQVLAREFGLHPGHGRGA